VTVRRSAFALAAVAGAVAVLLSLRGPQGAPLPEVAGGPVATDAPVAGAALRAAPPEAATSDPTGPAVTGASPREDRVAEVRAEAAEARANRQRLLKTTLADLSSAAERAEREGKPEYAANLRHRAEVLARSVRKE
jgi:hypothetical protein